MVSETAITTCSRKIEMKGMIVDMVVVDGFGDSVVQYFSCLKRGSHRI